VVDVYRAVLMRDRIGEVLTGTITGVTSFGMFVECNEPFIEGLIRMDSLGDRFELDENGVRLSGRRSGQTFTLGDTVTVKVEDVSLARRRIDLSLVQSAAAPARPPQQKKSIERKPSARNVR
jgi:ribonuclease R